MKCYSSKTKKIEKKRPVSKRLKSTPHVSRPVIAVNVILSIAFIAGMMGYLLQISSTTTYGFLVKQLQTKRSQTSAEVAIAQQRVTDLTSVEAIAEGAQALHMVPVGNVDFLSEIQTTGVAYSN